MKELDIDSENPLLKLTTRSMEDQSHLIWIRWLVQCKPHRRGVRKEMTEDPPRFPPFAYVKSNHRGPNSFRANQLPGPHNRDVFHRHSHVVRTEHTPATTKKTPVHTRIRTRTLRPTYGREEACTAPCRPHARGGSHEQGPRGGRARARAAMRPRAHVARIRRTTSASLKRRQSTRLRPSALTRRNPGPATPALTAALFVFKHAFPFENLQNTRKGML
jgi:hypothetical protein